MHRHIERRRRDCDAHRVGMQEAMFVELLDTNHRAVGRRKHNIWLGRRDALGVAVQQRGNCGECQRPGRQPRLEAK
jgi:hypothetical protein